MNKKNILSISLTLLVLLGFGIYIYNNPELLNILWTNKPTYLILIMFVFLIIFLLEGLFIRITLRMFDRNISIKESYYLSTLSRIGNYLLPLRAGAIFRATYLKQKYNFEYTKFLSTLYGYYIIFFLVCGVLGSIVLIIKYIVGSDIQPMSILFFIALSIGMLFLIFIRIPFKKILKSDKGVVAKIMDTLEKFMTSWDMIVKQGGLFVGLVGLTLGNILLNAVVTYLEFLAIGIDIKVLDVLLYTSLSSVSLLISLTPGSLGIREAVFLITSQSIGINNDQILQLAILDRAVLFVLLLVVLVVIVIFVREFKLKEVFFKSNEKES